MDENPVEQIYADGLDQKIMQRLEEIARSSACTQTAFRRLARLVALVTI